MIDCALGNNHRINRQKRLCAKTAIFGMRRPNQASPPRKPGFDEIENVVVWNEKKIDWLSWNAPIVAKYVLVSYYWSHIKPYYKLVWFFDSSKDFEQSKLFGLSLKNAHHRSRTFVNCSSFTILHWWCHLFMSILARELIMFSYQEK